MIPKNLIWMMAIMNDEAAHAMQSRGQSSARYVLHFCKKNGLTKTIFINKIIHNNFENFKCKFGNKNY